MKQPKKEIKTKRPRIEKKEKVASVHSTLTIEDLYEKYKGKLARTDNRVGVICGYTTNKLVMAVTLGFGCISIKDATIVTYLDNRKGYIITTEDHIL